MALASPLFSPRSLSLSLAYLCALKVVWFVKDYLILFTFFFCLILSSKVLLSFFFVCLRFFFFCLLLELYEVVCLKCKRKLILSYLYFSSFFSLSSHCSLLLVWICLCVRLRVCVIVWLFNDFSTRFLFCSTGMSLIRRRFGGNNLNLPVHACVRLKKETFSVLLREQTIGECENKIRPTTTIHGASAQNVLRCVSVWVCYCFRLRDCVFNLYLVFAIIAFSCNWHIECVCVWVCVWNARARENNSRFVRWRAARAVGWLRAHARLASERTHSRVSGERERFQFQSVATWIEPAFAIFVCYRFITRLFSPTRQGARASSLFWIGSERERKRFGKLQCVARFLGWYFFSVCVCVFVCSNY